MFTLDINQKHLSKLVAKMSDVDFARFLYCQHIASTHLAVGLFEDRLITTMMMCNRVQLEKKFGSDMPKWKKMLKKHQLLKDSTVGSLIQILARNNIDPKDLAYLKWIKDKRDYFVHRLYHDGAWPGDLDIDECRFITRRLMAVQLWLERAQRQILRIFERAGFVELIGSGNGIMIFNSGLFEELCTDDD